MKRLLLATTLFVSLPVGGARATTMLELSGPELALRSDAIVHARVVHLGGHVTDQARVFTDAELEVLDGLKGVATGARIRLSYPGGVHGGLGMFVSGQIALEQDSECVVYLSRGPGGVFAPAAMRQGFFSVRRRAYDGVREALRTTEGITLVRRDPKLPGMVSYDDTPKAQKATLLNVLSDIRADLRVAARSLAVPR